MTAWLCDLVAAEWQASMRVEILRFGFIGNFPVALQLTDYFMFILATKITPPYTR
jgi:hypothetical protein